MDIHTLHSHTPHTAHRTIRRVVMSRGTELGRGCSSPSVSPHRSLPRSATAQHHLFHPQTRDNNSEQVHRLPCVSHSSSVTSLLCLGCLPHRAGRADSCDISAMGRWCERARRGGRRLWPRTRISAGSQIAARCLRLVLYPRRAALRPSPAVHEPAGSLPGRPYSYATAAGLPDLPRTRPSSRRMPRCASVCTAYPRQASTRW